MWSLSEWRRQRILAQHPVAPDTWHDVRQRLSILDGLDDEQDRWLREHSVLFLQDKHLTPMPGVELSDESRLLLAAQAQLPLLNLGELDHFDYIHPALMQTDYLVWTRKDSAVVYSTAADLHGHKGAVSERARLSAEFETFASQQLNLQRLPNLTPAFQKLLLGEVDYVLAGRYSGMAMAQTLGMSNDLVAHEVPVDQPGLYLAVSHNSACNDPWLRGQLTKKMTELPASGAAQAALQRNLERWKAQLQQPVGTPTK